MTSISCRTNYLFSFAVSLFFSFAILRICLLYGISMLNGSLDSAFRGTEGFLLSLFMASFLGLIEGTVVGVIAIGFFHKKRYEKCCFMGIFIASLLIGSLAALPIDFLFLHFYETIAMYKEMLFFLPEITLTGCFLLCCLRNGKRVAPT